MKARSSAVTDERIVELYFERNEDAIHLFNETGDYLHDERGNPIVVTLYHIVLREEFTKTDLLYFSAGEAIGYIMPSSNSSYWDNSRTPHAEDRNLNAIRIETTCDVNLSDIIP